MRQWWMSFCDGHRPEGKQFLGVAIVAAPSLFEALTFSHLLGCNPGGEVGVEEVPTAFHFPPEMLGRLLSLGDLRAAGIETGTAEELGLQ